MRGLATNHSLCYLKHQLSFDLNLALKIVFNFMIMFMYVLVNIFKPCPWVYPYIYRQQSFLPNTDLHQGEMCFQPLFLPDADLHQVECALCLHTRILEILWSIEI